MNENNGYNGPEKKIIGNKQNKYVTYRTVQHKSSDERRVQEKKKKKMKKMKTQPNLVNDGSKEPQKQDEYSTSSSEKFY